jgi:D-methionine transport system ATP-binding protein
MIELINVSKIYKCKKYTITALDDISFKAPKGSVTGIIGESGAGKSTLVRCVNLLERPTSGKVVIDGQDLMQMKASELTAIRRKTGMIFQHFNLLSSRTVRENIAFPAEIAHLPKQEIRIKTDELLALVGLEDKADNYPSQLSGGQKQRVAIARALINEPVILLCDEATSALDPDSTANILSLLQSINQSIGLTILLITHEMKVVRSICDNVVVLSSGKIMEKGFDNKWFYDI